MPTISRRKFVTGLSALGCAPLGPVLAEEAGSWRVLADMPDAVQEIYPAAFRAEGRPFIVNAGGLAVSLGDPVKRACAVYDAQADLWTEGVPLPERRHHVALSNPAGAVHATGGFRRAGLKIWVMSTDHWRNADPRSDSWERARPMPGPRAEAVTLAHQGRIHVIGGRVPRGEDNGDWEDQGDTGLHWVYDPQDDHWRDLAPLPEARNSSTGAVIDGKLYVISGRTVAGGNTPACHRYDPGTDRWEAIAGLPPAQRQPAPPGQGGLAGAAFGGRLYVFGGEWFSDEGGVYADAWEYDPGGDRWRPVAAMPRPRHGLGAVALDDGIYVLGGALKRGGSGVTPFLERFIP